MVEKYLMYLRKSRADSDNETVEEVLLRHETILQEFAIKKFGQPIPESNIFREVVSGETIDKRPEMKKVLSLVANSDNYEGVIVVEPQRLSRGDMLDCGTIVRVFRYNNIKVLTPNIVFDLSQEHERKYFEMTLSQGNDYLEYIKTILIRGRLSSVKEGCYIGSKAPFGYDRVIVDKKHTLKPNSDAELVKLIFNMFVIDDMGTCVISQELNRRGLKPQKSDYWNPAVIRNILRNPVYIGKIRWNNKKVIKVTDEFGNTREKRDCKSPEKFVVDGLHQAIISEDIFNRAQKKIGNLSRVTTDKEIKNIFASLLKCGRCGKSYLLRQGRHPNQQKRIQCANQTNCHSASIRFETLKQAVIRSLLEYIDDFKIKLKNDDGNSLKVQQNILSKLKKQYDELSTQQNKLYELLEKSIYSDELFLERQATLNTQREKLENAISEQENNLPEAIDYQEKITSLRQALDCINSSDLSEQAKNTFLKTIIKRIDVTTPLSQKAHRVDLTAVEIKVHLK